jgi:phosphoribosylglycinamide formyltransferase-1
MRIALITSNEIRHIFFRRMVNAFKDSSVVFCICETTDNSHYNQVLNNKDSAPEEKDHFIQRENTEKDFFELFVKNSEEAKNTSFVNKGAINSDLILQEKLYESKPDIIVSYGSSIIKDNIINKFPGKFLNIHLGLSPYYKGAGTNLWPLVNNEPEYLGITYMYIDAGIDTGAILHQIRPNIYSYDNVHTIGNRLIKDMTLELHPLLSKIKKINSIPQWKVANEKIYKKKDFNKTSLLTMYENVNNGMLKNYLYNKKERDIKVPIVNFGIL